MTTAASPATGMAPGAHSARNAMTKAAKKGDSTDRL
jgi:hypothetical protein